MRSSRTEDASSEDREVAALAEENEVLPEPLVYAAIATGGTNNNNSLVTAPLRSATSLLRPVTALLWSVTSLLRRVTAPLLSVTSLLRPVTALLRSVTARFRSVTAPLRSVTALLRPMNGVPPVSNGALPTATESGDPPCESVRLLREF